MRQTKPDEKERYRKYLKAKGKKFTPIQNRNGSTKYLNNQLNNEVAAHALAEDQKRHKNIYELIFKKELESFGVKFTWQKPFFDNRGYFVTDFYIPQFKAVVEIDGANHETKKGKIKDQNRTEILRNRYGVSAVIRIPNTKLVRNIDEVRAIIIKRLI